MGDQFLDRFLAENKADTAVVALAEHIGTDWSQLAGSYQQMYEAAVERGYRATLLTQDGVVGIYYHNHLQLRVQIGQQRLQAGMWEESVVKLFAQVRLLNELPYDSNEGCNPERIKKTLLNIFMLPADAPLHCAVHHFPGATQCLVSLQEQLVASIVINPVHKFLLEFRLDPQPIELYNQLRSNTSAQAQDHALGFADATPGILQLAQREKLKSLIFIDGFETFGSHIRRTMLRLLPHLADLGFAHLVLDIEEAQEAALQQAIERADPLSFYLDGTPARPADISPEWTALLSLTRSIDMQVRGGAMKLSRAAIFQELQDPDANERCLLWLPFHHAKTASSWLELLHVHFEAEAVACIAPLRASQFSRLCPGADLGFKTPRLVPMTEVVQGGSSETSVFSMLGQGLSESTFFFVTPEEEVEKQLS